MPTPQRPSPLYPLRVFVSRAGLNAPRGLRPITAAFLIALLSAGCGFDTTNPKAYPYRVETAFEATNGSGRIHVIADLDGDGEDDFAYRRNLGPDGGQSVSVVVSSGVAVDEALVEGQIVRDLHAVDLDGDGFPELAVPYVRRDSLFIDGFTLNANRLKREWSFHVTTGQARMDDEHRYEWDPQILLLERMEVAPNIDQLIAVVSANYAAHPRGIFAFDIPSLARTDSISFGAKPGHVIRTDLDADGKIELLVASSPTKNGSLANGIADEFAWLILIELYPELQLVAKNSSTDNTTYRSAFTLDEGVSRTVISTSRKAGNAAAGRPAVYLLRDTTLTPEVSLPLGGNRFTPIVVEGNNDRELELLVSYDGFIERYDKSLNRIAVGREPLLSARLKKTHAAGTRGRSLLYQKQGESQFIVYDHLLSPIATVPAEPLDVSMRNDAVEMGRLVLRRGDVDNFTYEVVRLVPQARYMIHRHGRSALLLGIVLSILGVITFLPKHVGRISTLRKATHTIGVAVIRESRSGNRIVAQEVNARSLLSGRALSTSQLRDYWPELAALLAQHRETTTWPQTFSLRGPSTLPDTFLVTLLPRKENPIVASGRVILVRKHEAVRSAESGQAWQKLARRIVHDIRTPLSSIRLAAHQLGVRAEDLQHEQPADLAPYIRKIEEQVETIHEQTDQFLKAVDSTTANLEVAQVGPLIESLVKQARIEMPADIALSVSVPSELPQILVDNDELTAVLTELIRNARAAMPSGGRITVRARSSGPPNSSRGWTRGSSYVAIEVIDTGHGMNAETLSRLFESGYTTRSDGTGLGMSIARRVVEGYGGLITVHSDEGIGTEVIVHIPAVSGVQRPVT